MIIMTKEPTRKKTFPKTKEFINTTRNYKGRRELKT